MNNNIIFNDLLKYQLKDIPRNKKLGYDDLLRVAKFIPSTIFNNNDCVLWSGYASKRKTDNKYSEIKFRFNNEKQNVHRLLYLNYIDKHIDDNSVIRHICKNVNCVNLNHIKLQQLNRIVEVQKKLDDYRPSVVNINFNKILIEI